MISRRIIPPPSLLLRLLIRMDSSSSSSSSSVFKDHKSSVCIIPPIEHQGAIQTLRKLHDKQINRWPPHINLLYPFVPFAQFEGEVLQILTQVGSEIAPFKLSFPEFGYFSHGKKSSTVWLGPVTEPKNALQRLEEALVKAFPLFNDQLEKGPEFSPHLTVGQFQGKADAEHRVQEFSSSWKPVEFIVDHLCLISRPGPDDPFEIRHKIMLTGKH